MTRFHPVERQFESFLRERLSIRARREQAAASASPTQDEHTAQWAGQLGEIAARLERIEHALEERGSAGGPRG